MLGEARRKAAARGVEVDWTRGDMREFDLGRSFDLVIIAANSLLHLHDADSLVSCFRSVRAHLAPGGRLVFDVFNPSVRLLSEADGVRRTRESLSFVDPERGEVTVDVAEAYDAADQVTAARRTSSPRKNGTSWSRPWPVHERVAAPTLPLRAGLTATGSEGSTRWTESRRGSPRVHADDPPTSARADTVVSWDHVAMGER